jgi:hypothetical protein
LFHRHVDRGLGFTFADIISSYIPPHRLYFFSQSTPNMKLAQTLLVALTAFQLAHAIPQFGGNNTDINNNNNNGNQDQNNNGQDPNANAQGQDANAQGQDANAQGQDANAQGNNGANAQGQDANAQGNNGGNAQGNNGANAGGGNNAAAGDSVGAGGNACLQQLNIQKASESTGDANAAKGQSNSLT